MELSGDHVLLSAARNRQNNQEVAIKKLTKIFDKSILSKRALREVKLLTHFNGHENVTTSYQDHLHF
jgi:mitogen-activated protein kinase 7